MPRIRIGLSGRSYDSWRGDFYPEGLARTRQLAYASRRFDSLEINGSFCALLNPDVYRRFHRETPADAVRLVEMLGLKEGRVGDEG